MKKTILCLRKDCQIRVEDRGGEEDAVDEVERAADAWDEATGVFAVGVALDDGFAKVADDADDA